MNILIQAIYNRNVDEVKSILEAGEIDPAIEDDYYPITIAAVVGNVDIVKTLLEDDRVDASIKSNHALYLAAIYGHTEIVDLLLKNSKVLENLDIEDINKSALDKKSATYKLIKQASDERSKRVTSPRP